MSVKVDGIGGSHKVRGQAQAPQTDRAAQAGRHHHGARNNGEIFKRLEDLLRQLEAMFGAGHPAASPAPAQTPPAPAQANPSHGRPPASTPAVGGPRPVSSPAPSHMPTNGHTPTPATGAASPSPAPGSAASVPSPSTSHAYGQTGSVDKATNVNQAAAETHVKFMPILRGATPQAQQQELAAQDAKIHDQASFGQAVDQAARDYGLSPNAFRAQMQTESWAFGGGYQNAMKLHGDTGRGDNFSFGIGQISMDYLNGGPWSSGGPNNPRAGGQTITSAAYADSPTLQLRVAASNLAQRIADNGNSLQKGLASYVSGTPDPSGAQASAYIAKINASMQDPSVEDPGR